MIELEMMPGTPFSHMNDVAEGKVGGGGGKGMHWFCISQIWK